MTLWLSGGDVATPRYRPKVPPPLAVSQLICRPSKVMFGVTCQWPVKVVELSKWPSMLQLIVPMSPPP